MVPLQLFGLEQTEAENRKNLSRRVVAQHQARLERQVFPVRSPGRYPARISSLESIARLEHPDRAAAPFSTLEELAEQQMEELELLLAKAP